jgi:hypothetical protein
VIDRPYEMLIDCGYTVTESAKEEVK